MKTSITLEHIDPRRGVLISGLENDFNEILVDARYNERKNNRFVPYRVCGYPAPVTFGDMCEFLIEDKWVVCEFGGDMWWKESNRIGCTHSQNVVKMNANRDTEYLKENGRNVGVYANTVWRDLNPDQYLANRRKFVEKHKRPIILIHPDGTEEGFGSAQEACEGYTLSKGNLHAVLNGTRAHHKGFTARYV